MDQKSVFFMKKLVAMLRLKGIRKLPYFRSQLFQEGMEAVHDTFASKHDHTYEDIFRLFIQDNVTGTYEYAKNIAIHLIALCYLEPDAADGRTMIIEMNEEKAKQILSDASVLNIDTKALEEAADNFCEAAGMATVE